MAGELLSLPVEFNSDRHIMPHFASHDEAKEQDRIRLMQDDGCRRMTAMDKLQKHRCCR